MVNCNPRYKCYIVGLTVRRHYDLVNTKNAYFLFVINLSCEQMKTTEKGGNLSFVQLCIVLDSLLLKRTFNEMR